jgi:hypothetical protein
MRYACLLFAFSVSTQAQSGSAPNKPASPDCPDSASKLNSWLPLPMHTHPQRTGKMEKMIIGVVVGNCATIESVPGRHTMQCEFPPDIPPVATSIGEMQAAQAAGKPIGFTFTSRVRWLAGRRARRFHRRIRRRRDMHGGLRLRARTCDHESPAPSLSHLIVGAARVADAKELS